MNVTPEQKHLVRDSWARIVPIRDTAAGLFYDRLFAVYPEVKPYFRGNMQEQGRKLMAMLNTAVGALDDLDSLTAALQQSGRAHADHGVQADDYDKVADAFLWTLGQGLGEAFTPEVRDAWVAVYSRVAGVMIEGAESVALDAST